jgi:hypothetical protein
MTDSVHQVEQLRAENAELRHLLEKIQWSGLTPIKSHGCCPECSGSVDRGHRPRCALAAALGAQN